MKKDQPSKIFMLIDGSAILHRAYHAMPPFTTSTGFPTGAVHGFFAMLLKLMQELKPEYIAVAFDLPKPTFRQELYVGYQSTRAEISSDLGDQFQIVREILSEGRIPVYEVGGFEADDVIGTIVEKVNKELKDTMVYVVTGDRDMMQLVNHKAKVLMPVKGISEMKLFDSKRVKEQFGVDPLQIIDYKALTGDASDNYPGVAGVGPKTAMQLLSEYHTLEGIYKHIGEIEQKNKKLSVRLAEGAENAALAKKLATIVCDVPFVFNVNLCKSNAFSPEGLLECFQKYELKTIGKRFKEMFDGEDKKTQMKLL